MELNRRQTLTVLAITAAATLPASAAKAVTQPLFTYFESNLDSRGTVKVGVACAVPVVSVSARLLNQLGTEVARYQLTLLTGSDPKNGSWVTGPLTGIPLGTYTMRYEATSQDGGVSSAQAELFVWLLPEFTLTATPTRISPAQPTVTVEGTVMGRHPVTQAVTPIVGLPLRLIADHFNADVPDLPPVMVTSTAGGRFTGQFAPRDTALLSVSTNAPGRETLVFERSFTGSPVTVSRVPVRITLTVDATHIDVGRPSTVDGLLEHKIEDQWVPFPARALSGAFYVHGSSDGAVWQPVTTDSRGRFRLTTTPPSWGQWMVAFAKEFPFYDATSAASQVVFIADPVHFDQVKATPTLRPDDGYSWQVTGLVSNRRFAPTVVVQYRPGAAGSWQELSRVVADTAYEYPMWAFKAVVRLPASGQVRVYCPATDHTQAAASDVLAIHVGFAKTPLLRRDPGQPAPPGRRTRPPTR